MDDRELLELAAKAAGMKARWFKVKKWRDYPASRILCGHDDVFGTHHSKPWNPITDDGDAFRLAAALKLTADFENGSVWGAGDLDETRLGHATADEPCMRRAIVRAAAEIGRAM